MRPMRETVWKTRQGSQPKTEVEHTDAQGGISFFLNEERRGGPIRSRPLSFPPHPPALPCTLLQVCL